MTTDRRRKWRRGLLALVILVGCAVGGATWLDSPGSAKPDAAASLSLVIPAFGKTSLAQIRSRYEMAAADDPLDQFAWYDLGVIAQQSGAGAIAGVDFRMALMIDPQYEAARYESGRPAH